MTLNSVTDIWNKLHNKSEGPYIIHLQHYTFSCIKDMKNVHNYVDVRIINQCSYLLLFWCRSYRYLKDDVMFGSSVVTIELQPLLVVTVRARGGRDSAGLLGTYLQKLLSEKYVWNFLHILCVSSLHFAISSLNFPVLIIYFHFTSDSVMRWQTCFLHWLY
jgi:hypothetical protein